MTKSANELSNDLTKIRTVPMSQWKMNFNPNPTKQVQKVVFSRKIQYTNHPCLIFNRKTVSLNESQKHPGIVLNSRLDFKEHLKIIFKKASKAIGPLSNFYNLLPRKLLITVYKYFIRLYLDDGDIIYDQAYNASFYMKLESIQYNVPLAITDVIFIKNLRNNPQITF